jgi:hypothetical protein
MNVLLDDSILQGLANNVERAVYKVGHRDALRAASELVRRVAEERPLTGFGKILGTYGKVESWPELPESSESERS